MSKTIAFQISEEQHAEVERNLNAAIHELVFAIQHSEQD